MSTAKLKSHLVFDQRFFLLHKIEMSSVEKIISEGAPEDSLIQLSKHYPTTNDYSNDVCYYDENFQKKTIWRNPNRRAVYTHQRFKESIFNAKIALHIGNKLVSSNFLSITFSQQEIYACFEMSLHYIIDKLSRPPLENLDSCCVALQECEIQGQKVKILYLFNKYIESL